MNELEIFNNPEFGQIRATEINGEPYFVGKDVCDAFGDTNYRRSLSKIDDSDKGVPVYIHCSSRCNRKRETKTKQL